MSTLKSLTKDKILNLILPEPQIRGADRIFSFSLHQNEEAKKIIYCSKIGGVELKMGIQMGIHFDNAFY